jgi:hypothetical protein
MCAVGLNPLLFVMVMHFGMLWFDDHRRRINRSRLLRCQTTMVQMMMVRFLDEDRIGRQQNRW